MLTVHQNKISDTSNSRSAERPRDESGRTRYFNEGGATGTTKKMAQMLEAANKAVTIRGIAKEAPKDSLAPQLDAVTTTRTDQEHDDDSDDDDAPCLPKAASLGQTAPSTDHLNAVAQDSDHDDDSEDDDEEDEDEDEEPPPLE